MLFDQVYDPVRAEELFAELVKLPDALEIGLVVTNRCPNGCDYCAKDCHWEGTDLNLDGVKSFINDMLVQGTKLYAIYSTGGEPLFNDGFLGFLEYLKSNEKELFFNGRYCVTMVTSSVDPMSEHASVYNERMRVCLNKDLINYLVVSYSAGFNPQERVKNLDLILGETGSFIRLRSLKLRHTGRGYDDDYSWLPNEGEYVFQKLCVKNNGRNDSKLEPSYAMCSFTRGISKMKNGHKLPFDNLFRITIDEYGNVMPCCSGEAWIGKIVPFANIFEHGYEDVIKRALCYDEVLKSFFYENAFKAETCSLCGSEFNDFLRDFTPTQIQYIGR